MTIICIFSDKQTTLEKIREKLAAQMKTRVDDEDDRIRKAVEEAEEKRAKDDAEREAKARKMIQEANEHRTAMVCILQTLSMLKACFIRKPK